MPVLLQKIIWSWGEGGGEGWNRGSYPSGVKAHIGFFFFFCHLGCLYYFIIMNIKYVPTWATRVGMVHKTKLFLFCFFVIRISCGTCIVKAGSQYIVRDTMQE